MAQTNTNFTLLTDSFHNNKIIIIHLHCSLAHSYYQDAHDENNNKLASGQEKATSCLFGLSLSLLSLPQTACVIHWRCCCWSKSRGRTVNKTVHLMATRCGSQGTLDWLGASGTLCAILFEFLFVFC